MSVCASTMKVGCGSRIRGLFVYPISALVTPAEASLWQPATGIRSASRGSAPRAVLWRTGWRWVRNVAVADLGQSRRALCLPVNHFCLMASSWFLRALFGLSCKRIIIGSRRYGRHCQANNRLLILSHIRNRRGVTIQPESSVGKERRSGVIALTYAALACIWPRDSPCLSCVRRGCWSRRLVSDLAMNRWHFFGGASGCCAGRAAAGGVGALDPPCPCPLPVGDRATCRADPRPASMKWRVSVHRLCRD